MAEELRQRGYLTAGISNNPWVGSIAGMDKGFNIFVESDGSIFNSLEMEIDIPVKVSILNNLQNHLNSFSLKLLIPYLIKRPEFSSFSIRLAKKIMRYSIRKNKPFFIFMNLMDTHQPYYPPLSIINDLSDDSYLPFQSLFDNYWIRNYYRGKSNKGAIVSILNDYYDASLKYQDRLFGELIDSMNLDGVIDNTMIFFTSDHGKILGEYNPKNYINYLKDIVLRVPLIVSFPELFRKGLKLDNNCQLIDINYTIKNIINIPLLHSNDIGLLKNAEEGERRYSYVEAELPFNHHEKKQIECEIDYIEGVIDGENKIIRSRSKGLGKSNYNESLECFDFHGNETLSYYSECLRDHKEFLISDIPTDKKAKIRKIIRNRL